MRDSDPCVFMDRGTSGIRDSGTSGIRDRPAWGPKIVCVFCGAISSPFGPRTEISVRDSVETARNGGAHVLFGFNNVCGWKRFC